MKPRAGQLRFVFRTTLLHAATYLVVGIAAAISLGYADLFEEPVIRDYMRPFGSVAVFVGPLIQVLRGAIIAAVLIPFRGTLAHKGGWLWLWLLLVGIGILSTSAAAPSSLEGVVYTELPLWYHLIGLPEMLTQTLIFSALVAFYERHPAGVLASLPPIFDRLMRALVVTSLSFVGIAIASAAFALLAGADIADPQNVTLRVQGTFAAPLLINGAIAFAFAKGQPGSRARLLAGALSWGLGAIAIMTYQGLVLGNVDLLYGLVAPVLPAAILALMIGTRQPKTSLGATAE